MSKLLFLIVGLLMGSCGRGVLRRHPSRLGKAPPPQDLPGPEARIAAPAEAVCTGMVEAAGGQINVFAQMPGELVEVGVREGESVHKGQVVAVLDARRLEAETDVAAAAVAMAQAKLKRIQAGVGKEEKQEALYSVRGRRCALKVRICQSRPPAEALRQQGDQPRRAGSQ